MNERAKTFEQYEKAILKWYLIVVFIGVFFLATLPAINNYIPALITYLIGAMYTMLFVILAFFVFLSFRITTYMLKIYKKMDNNGVLRSIIMMLTTPFTFAMYYFVLTFLLYYNISNMS